MKLNYTLSLLLLLLFVISCSSSDDTITPPQDNNEEEIVMEQETEEEEEEEIEMTEEEETNNKLAGNFVSAAHPTSGIAMINEERTQLMLTNFKSDNGPLLELYIATDTDATDYVSLGIIGQLGSMDVIEGDIVFDLPTDINFATHKYIMVWCVDFSVNFGHAVVE